MDAFSFFKVVGCPDEAKAEGVKKSWRVLL